MHSIDYTLYAITEKATRRGGDVAIFDAARAGGPDWTPTGRPWQPGPRWPALPAARRRASSGRAFSHAPASSRRTRPGHDANESAIPLASSHDRGAGYDVAHAG